jgi:hypothetical protein
MSRIIHPHPNPLPSREREIRVVIFLRQPRSADGVSPIDPSIFSEILPIR